MFGAAQLNGLGKRLGSRFQQEITLTGNTQIDTAQSKFGGSSILLDGVNDSFYSTSDQYEFLDAFTLEFWVRIQDQGASQVIMSNRPTTGYSTGNFYIQWSDADSKFQWGISGGSAVLSASTFSYNTWYHIALVRNSSTVQLYVSGTAQGSSQATSDANDIGTNSQTTLYWGLLGSTYDFVGHIDEIRVSDTARYSTTFTPSATAFTSDANTVLLIHGDGADASTTILDDNE